MSSKPNHKTRTLWLAGALHAFTHVYQVALMPLYLLIIPLLWAIIGSTAAVRFGITEDFGLIVTAAITAFFIFRRSFAPEEEVFL